MQLRWIKIICLLFSLNSMGWANEEYLFYDFFSYVNKIVEFTFTNTQVNLIPKTGDFSYFKEENEKNTVFYFSFFKEGRYILEFFIYPDNKTLSVPVMVLKNDSVLYNNPSYNKIIALILSEASKFEEKGDYLAALNLYLSNYTNNYIFNRKIAFLYTILDNIKLAIEYYSLNIKSDNLLLEKDLIHLYTLSIREDRYQIIYNKLDLILNLNELPNESFILDLAEYLANRKDLDSLSKILTYYREKYLNNINIPEVSFFDKYLYLSALEETLQNKTENYLQAMQLYKKLLSEYPDSQYYFLAKKNYVRLKYYLNLD